MEQPFKDDTILARWLSGEMSEEEKRELEQTPDFHKYRRLIEASNQVLSPEFDQDAAWNRLNQSRSKERVLGRRKLIMRWAYGVAAIILIAFAFLFLLPHKTEIIALAGEKVNHQFPDASTVELNAGSSIEYMEGNWEEERVVQLSGEAFFDVRKGGSFVVKTSKGDIEVVGTAFNVFIRKERFEVACYEGKVHVISKEGKTNVVGAGDRLLLTKEGMNTHTLVKVDMPGWINGETIFVEEKLSNVFLELERQFNVTVELTASTHKRYNGPLPHQSLEQALKIVCEAMELNYSFITDKKIRIEER